MIWRSPGLANLANILAFHDMAADSAARPTIDVGIINKCERCSHILVKGFGTSDAILITIDLRKKEYDLLAI